MGAGTSERDPWQALLECTAAQRAEFVRAWATSEDPGALLEAAQLELDARVQFWASELASQMGRTTRPAATHRVSRTLRFLRRIAVPGLMLVGLVAAILDRRGMVTAVVLLVAMGAAFILPLSAWRTRRRFFWNQWAALTLGYCPACSYDLSGLSDQIVKGLALRDIGPDRCPECGMAWPLVPPQIPSDIRSDPIAT